jgi:hypothetical protein
MPDGGTGILGLNPDWLKYGALGLLAIAILVVGAITFQGPKNKASFRLALVFMGFSLVVAALAIGSEIFRESSTAKQMAEQLDAARKQASDAAAAAQAAVTARTAAEKALADLMVVADKTVADLKALAAKTTATVTGEVGKIANALDAKWCVEVQQMNDAGVKDNLKFLIGQMRGALSAIQKTMGAAEARIPNECTQI